MSEDNLMNKAFQVFFGLVIIILLYIITLVILNIDSLVVNRTPSISARDESIIIDGYGSSSYLAKRSFNTVNYFDDTYVKIMRSVNTYGGLQFTYQFWINLNDISSVNRFKDQIILFRGDKQRYKYALYDIDPPYQKKFTSNQGEYLIACPLIKFNNSYKDLCVKFNTNKTLMYETNITMNTQNDITRRNVMSLLPLNWYLFTFVFEDNFSTVETTENGIKFTFYINDFPYHTVTASSDPTLRNNFLRHNEGDLHILPDLVDASELLTLGNIKYFNYAVKDNDIRNHFLSGPPTHNANINEGRKMQPAYLSAYNKMDIYNY